MMSCIERKAALKSKSFNSSTGMFKINSPELKLLYEQNAPFWKKKCFLIPTILIILTILSLSTFFTIDTIYNQGKSANSILDFLNTSRQEFEKPAEFNSEKSSRSVHQRIRRFQNGLDEIHEQEIFVPCELNNGIKELNNQILRLTDSLTRLDYRVNRKKRGLPDQTAIIDCIEMKDKFNKIYEDLRRISEIFTMMDDNGICRCKCPLNRIINTTADIVHITDIPFDLTTFALKNTHDKQSDPNKKTKQLKKIILSDYIPQKNIDDENKFKSVHTYDESAHTTSTTTYGVNQFTIIPTLEDDNTQEDESATVADTKEDMSSEMSNAVTKYLIPDGFGRTTIEPPTLNYMKNLTKDYRDTQLITTETPENLTEVTDLSETIKTTRLKLEISAIQEKKSDNDDFPSSSTTYENISESTTDFDNYKNNNNYAKYKTSESTSTFENHLESTTAEATNFDKDNTNDTDIVFTSTPEYQKHVTEPTTELSNLEGSQNNDKVTDGFKSTYGYENISESSTELLDLRENKNNKKVTEDLYEYENISESTTELLNSKENDYNKNITKQALKSTSPTYTNFAEFTKFVTNSDEYKNGFDVTQKPVESTYTNKNNRAPTSVVPMFDNNSNLKERTSSEDQSRNDNNELKNGYVINRFNIGKSNVENKNNSTPRDYESRSTARPVTTEQIQPKWYPVCFYPVPCSQGNQQQNTQDTSKINTVQYSAQSLSTYKKNAPPATVIQNNYPIISYCPMGMVCSMTDSAGQSNILHCMLKPTALPGGFENISKNNETNWASMTKDNHDAKSSGTTNAKSARYSDEILTGNIDCPLNTFPCLDDSGCVETENWCDGRIHCNDASDESQCNCKERIDKDKLCDGYYDCPSGEDELGCFGCNNDTFSCGDWDGISQRSTCFERKTRCDFIKHCPNGRDEDECTLLSRRLENPNQIFFISYSTGYLHHNWKGNWYPMCGEDTIKTWAEKACTVESGEMSKPNKIQYMNDLSTYEGPYISIDRNNQITLLSSCKHQGIQVECAPETCGIRSELKFNKNIDPDRLRRSPYLEQINNVTTRFVRSKDPRVVGGIASNPGAWPWLIALYQDGIFHCGGVILSDRWVLTAAHCVHEYQKHFYEVQAGILRRFSFSPMEQSKTVTHVIVHTQYSRTTMENDLAVMRLERNLEFNRWIRPVCLPDQKLNWIPFPGTICTAVGWGSTVEHGPDPDNMREVEVPILAECTHKTDVDGKEICAGYLSGGHDTCQGDSGGPLLCREPNNLDKWYVAGIVSHGEGCARPMEPGVYTRVALFMDWILRVTEEDNLPPERPQQYCPGIRCRTGKQCVPTKRQCDKYVDCMNAEDEQNCDYSGSQYHVDLYRSRNTDHSNFKYSKFKSGEALDAAAGVNVTTLTMEMSTIEPRPTTALLANVNTTSSPQTKISNMDVKVDTQPIEIEIKNNTTGLNDTVLNAIRQLFDNQFTENTFSCGRITQVVLSSHRCDGTVDCEDGTDEESCDCRTRLANMFNASAICDGVADCPDGTDETGCGGGRPHCGSDETPCGRSNKCVKKIAWCDGVVDCNEDDGSDEKYCVAITNGTTAVEMDVTGRPALRQSGIVAMNRNGVWRVRCVQENTATKIADETCSSLNFLNSIYFEKRISWNTRLPLNMSKLRLSDVCHGLYVECGPRKKVVEGWFNWHVDILVDGTLTQSGVLIEDSWVLVKRTSINLKTAYVTAVLGGSAYSSVWIGSPHEQIVRVDGVKPVLDLDFDLLHLARPAGANHAVGPLGVPLFQPPLRPDDACYAVGYATDSRGHNRTVTAILRPDTRQCDPEDTLCFTVSRKPQSCVGGSSNGRKSVSHVSAIVCESNIGLFLAAPTIQRTMNFCDRNMRVQLPIAEDLMNGIVAVTDERIKPTSAPVCHGKRCKLGKCVPWEKVCDGIPDCRDEQDETIKMCQERANRCKTNDTLCICDVSSFRCANGKCVPKAAFCDGNNDCGDWTDEPKTCEINTCVDYLKLTAPGRLCDGRWDCLDKTDEEFTNCPGYCNRTNVYQCQTSNKCISLELVCDGEEDCPESDDEAECIGLITPSRKSNEGVLAIRSYGNWHAQCITEDYTNVDYHSLCKGLGFKSAVGIKKIPNTKVDFENFMIVQLNVRTDVTIRSATKNIIQSTDHECTATYVVCSS